MLETPGFGFWRAVWQRGCIYRGRKKAGEKSSGRSLRLHAIALALRGRKGLSPKPVTNETNRRMYVEDERESNPAIGWFFQYAGRGCRHARHRGCNQYDRESELSESAGRLGGGESRHWEALGLNGRCSRWKQENHRREEQATRNCYQRVASARTLRGGHLQERYGDLQVQRIRSGFSNEGDTSAFVGEDPQGSPRRQ